MRNLLALAAALLAAPLLSGCFGMAAAGIGASVLMADDRRTAGVYVEDENIEWKALALVRERFPSSQVNATSYNRRLLLTGQVPDEAARSALAEAARGIASVRDVVNEVTVGTNSTVASRGNDTLVTSNVKARMLGTASSRPITSRSSRRRAWSSCSAWSPRAKPMPPSTSPVAPRASPAW